MTNDPAGADGRTRAWLFGPVPDLALGCGGLYLAAWLVLGGLAPTLLEQSPASLAPLLILLVSIPHYGATLLRVYERRHDRTTYAVFALWITLVLVVAFAISLHHFAFACWMVTLYLTWSPWHYSGQNFGIALLFLGRRGVDVSGAPRRWLHASFVLSFLLTALVIHTRAGRMADYQIPAGLAQSVRFVPLGLPDAIADAAIGAVALAWLVCTGASLALLLRRAPLRSLVPVCSIVLLQSLWFTLPYGLGYLGLETGLPVIDLGPRQQFFTYIAIGHALQYLWITSYFARASSGWTGFGRYLTKSMLFGQAVALTPLFLVAGLGIGDRSYDGGLLLLVVAFMNLHHFILDGAIWKLRGGRIARILLRADREEAPAASSSWARRLAWSLASGIFIVGLVAHYDRHHALPEAIALRNPERVRQALDRLARLGHEGGSDRLRLAILYADAGEPVRAEEAVRRSLALRATPEGYGVLGRLRSEAGDWTAARSAYQDGLALAPGDVRLLRGAGLAAHRLGDWDDAATLLQAAIAGGRSDPTMRHALREARDRQSRMESR